MSLHAKPKFQVVIKLREQQRRCRNSSMFIATATLLLLLLILAWMHLPALTREIPVIVVYESEVLEDEAETPEKFTRVLRPPAAPSSAMPKVIAATRHSNFTIPVVESDVETLSLDFGDGNGYGSGWGSGFGDGAGGGVTSFFNQKIKATRLCYVIDYSLSMRDLGRDELMRRELAKSVGNIAHGIQYQILFFSGPAWVAGDSVVSGPNPEGPSEATVTRKTGKPRYQWTAEHLWKWRPVGRRQTIDWMTANEDTLQESLSYIASTPLIGGTDWETPLEMVIQMNPPPQQIFFMTDGAMEKRDMIDLVRGIAKKAVARKISINTIALMEPRAQEPMAELARMTDGSFTIVEAGGSVRNVPLK